VPNVQPALAASVGARIPRKAPIPRSSPVHARPVSGGSAGRGPIGGPAGGGREPYCQGDCIKSIRTRLQRCTRWRRRTSNRSTFAALGVSGTHCLGLAGVGQGPANADGRRAGRAPPRRWDAPVMLPVAVAGADVVVAHACGGWDGRAARGVGALGCCRGGQKAARRPRAGAIPHSGSARISWPRSTTQARRSAVGPSAAPGGRPTARTAAAGRRPAGLAPAEVPPVGAHVARRVGAFQAELAHAVGARAFLWLPAGGPRPAWPCNEGWAGGQCRGRAQAPGGRAGG
jgi:hypothetical protein